MHDLNSTSDTTRRICGVTLAVFLLLVPLGCARDTGDDAEDRPMAEEAAAETYAATLHAVNESLTGPITGTARVTVADGRVTLALEAEGVPADMMHLQHTHGMTDGTKSTCPGAGADGNGDGVVDLIEAEQHAGTTMIPFHENPVSMEIEAESYPRADADGRIVYEKTVPVEELRRAFTGRFEGQAFDWARRVVMVHGVPEGTGLPATAGSLPDVPARVTLPIACGVLEPEDGS